MFQRTLWKKLEEELTTKEAIVLTGPRRVGKTSTIAYLFDKIPSRNKLTFDLTRVGDQRVFGGNDYERIIDEFRARGANLEERLFVTIDEIQFLPDLPRVVKYLYDHYQIKFFLTGSSSYYLKNHFSESLAGRKLIFELMPLSFGEYLVFKKINYRLRPINWAQVEASTFDVLAYEQLKLAYSDFQEFGGFPEVVLESKRERKNRLLDEIFSAYINQDVALLADFKKIADLKTLISLLAIRVGNRLGVDDLSVITGLSRPTIMNYFTFLEETYLIKTIPVYTGSQDVAGRKSKKLYFIDTGIANINADLSGGQKLENTVFHQLSFYGELSYYVDRDGEIDFILRYPRRVGGKVVALEVKQTPLPTAQTALRSRSTKLKIDHYALVGSHQAKKFDNYLLASLIP
jgi:predicted AAA+ superfamily ATPase